MTEKTGKILSMLEKEKERKQRAKPKKRVLRGSLADYSKAQLAFSAAETLKREQAAQ